MNANVCANLMFLPVCPHRWTEEEEVTAEKVGLASQREEQRQRFQNSFGFKELC